jgi:hypothetical protein
MPDKSRSNKTATAGDQNAARRDRAISLYRFFSPHPLTYGKAAAQSPYR